MHVYVLKTNGTKLLSYKKIVASYMIALMAFRSNV